MRSAARVGSPTHLAGVSLAMGLLLVGSALASDDAKPNLAAWGQSTFFWSDDGKRWTEFARMPDGGYAKNFRSASGS